MTLQQGSIDEASPDPGSPGAEALPRRAQPEPVDTRPPWGAIWPEAWTRRSLPWLTLPAIALGVLLMVSPYVLVQIPPLIDLPGHMGGAAIETAAADSPLRQYFHWNWAFSLNMGGEVLMKLIGDSFGMLAAGWWSAVIATGLVTLGGLATIRALNPRGGHGTPWALLMVYTFPLLTGFLNYELAIGVSLCAFAASVLLADKPWWRAAVLVAAQPLAMLCHAIGGLVLPVLVGMHALGALIDERPMPWKAVLRRPWLLRWHALELLRRCWPLVGAVVMIVLWKALVPSNGGLLRWRGDEKAWALLNTLRDQSILLDVASAVAVLMILVTAYLRGARWGWARLLPGMAVLALYLAMPSDINGSSFVDVRLLPVAVMLLLGLCDWSVAAPRKARMVARMGAVLLGVRLTVTAASFADYADDYSHELAALAHVTPGSRVLAFVEHTCPDERWRTPRTDHLGSLAGLYRQAWVNDNWAVPGLDMLQPRFRPARYFFADPSEFVWSPGCGHGRMRSVDSALARAPIDMVDYVWLIGTGLPHQPDPRLHIIWQDGRSSLFAVRTLGIPTWTLGAE